MKRNAKKFLVFTVAAALCCCHVEAQKNRHNRDRDKGSLTEEQRMNLTFNFYNASKEKILGNFEKAADLYAQCLRIDPHHAASMYEMANIYMGQKKSNDALYFAKAATEQAPDNIWYQLLLAEVYENTGKYEEAISVYEDVIKKNPGRLDFYFALASMYLYQNKPAEAIKVYDKVEAMAGVSKELSVQKERLYLKMNKVDKAAAELEKLIAKFPDDLEAYALLVEMYQVNNQEDKAFETIQRMQRKAPESPHVYLALAEYYRQKGDKEKSFENLKAAFTKPELEPEIKIKVLESYAPMVSQVPEMMDQSLQLAKILVETHPDDPIAFAVYGEFLSLDKNYSEARKAFRSSIELDNKNYHVWQQLLFIESEMSDFSAMLTESDEALTLFPEQPLVYLLNGIANHQAKKYEEATKALLAGSKMVVDDNALLKDFYSNLGDNYNALKNYPESDKYFEKALEIDPRNANVLNNYSYYLSLREEKLDRAATMSKLSNELAPGNPSYQDTYGWILYKQGKYKEAREWLDKAMANGGDKNDTILEHYGDVLYKLGEDGKALEYWQKAKSAGPGSDQLNKKITDKKLYE